MKKRILRVILSFCMIVSMTSTMVFAVDITPSETPQTEEVVTTKDEVLSIEGEVSSDEAGLSSTESEESVKEEVVEKTAIEVVVELFNALPTADTITTETTEGEKEAISAELAKAMAAYEALSEDEQEEFMAKYGELLVVAMTLNEALDKCSFKETDETQGFKDNSTTMTMSTIDQADLFNTIYMPIYSSGNIDIIDIKDNSIKQSAISNVGRNPSSSIQTPDGRYILVSSHGKLTIIDASTNTIYKNLSFGASLRGIGFNDNGNKAYISDSGQKSVHVVSLDTLELVKTISLGASGSAQGNSVGVGKYIYVACSTPSVPGDVFIIDSETDEIFKTISFPTAERIHPYILVANPDGSKVYVGNQGGNTTNIKVIDTATNTIDETASFSNGKDGSIEITPDGKYLYVARNYDSKVYVYEIATKTLVKTISVGKGPYAIGINKDGTKAYTANFSGENISVIDTRTDAVTAITTSNAPFVIGSFMATTYISAGAGNFYSLKVSIASINSSLSPGSSQKFTATVRNWTTNSGVTWSLSGNASSSTEIDVDGNLTIGTDETSKNISVIATSIEDVEKSDTIVVAINYDPKISVAEQNGTVTTGTAGSVSFEVTTKNFGGDYPEFAPSVDWTAPTGVVTAFSEDKTTLALTTTDATPAGKYTFKVVSVKAPETDGNYESDDVTFIVREDLNNVTYSVKDGKINGTTTNMEYSINGGDWISCNDTETRVIFEVGTVKIRDKNDNTHERTVGTIATAGTAPSYAIDFANEKTNQSVPTTDEYKIRDGEWISGTGAQINITPGTNYQFRIKATDTVLASNIKTLTAPARPTAPSTSAVASTKGTNQQTTKLTFDANFAKYEYAVVAHGATPSSTDWSTPTTQIVDNISGRLSTDDVYVRVKATASAFTSTATKALDSLDIQKLAYTGTEAGAPTLLSKTDKKVVLNAVSVTDETVEYAVSTSNTAPTTSWQDSATFTGLTANTDYYFFARVKETDANYAGEASASLTVKTKKAPAVAPTVGTPTVTQNTITLPENSLWEYSTDGTTWNNKNEFTGLNPATEYTYYVRVKETDDAMSSEKATVKVYTAAKTPIAGEGYTVNYEDETITVDEGYEVKKGDGSWSNTTTFEAGASYEVRVKKTDNVPASKEMSFTVANRPTAPNVEIEQETIKNKKDGKVTGLKTTLEYLIGSDTTWTTVTSDVLTGLSDETVKVRVKATSTAPHGEETSLTFTASTVTLTVTFESNGGSLVTNKDNLSYNDIITAPVAPTKTGYYFVGWFKDSNLAQPWNFLSDKATDNSTLYAKWSAVPVYSVSGNVKEQTSGSEANVADAIVELKKGEQVFAATTTDASGNYNFSAVVAGEYNLVVSKGDKTGTILVVVTNANETGKNITLPKGKLNYVVEVSPNTPSIVVGGLDLVANANASINDSDKVEVKLVVESQSESTAPSLEVSEIKKQAGNQSLGYLDISIEHYINSAKQNNITDTNTNIIEMIIPYDFANKKDITIYRYHDTTASKFERLSTRPTSSYEDGKYFLGENYIVVYTSKFSTYAVGYTPISTSGGNTSSGSEKRFEIKATAGAGGTISSEEVVYVTGGGSAQFDFTPNKGYKVSKVIVNGTNLGVLDTYVFKDVWANQTIEVHFSKIYTSTNTMINNTGNKDEETEVEDTIEATPTPTPSEKTESTEVNSDKPVVSPEANDSNSQGNMVIPVIGGIALVTAIILILIFIKKRKDEEENS